MRSLFALSFGLLFLGAVDVRSEEFSEDFNNVNDRPWIGSAFWANPMEDFRVSSGRIEATRGGPDRNVALLAAEMKQPTKPFELSMKVGRVAAGEGSVGFRLGVRDEIDDYRAAAMRGSGLNVGVTTSGLAFIGTPPAIKVKRKPLPEAIVLKVSGKPDGEDVALTVEASDAKTGDKIDSATKSVNAEQLAGLVVLTNNGHASSARGGSKPRLASAARHWFDDLSIKGDNVVLHADRHWGPILWAMHTVHNTHGDDGYVLKMTAQMAPVGKKDPQKVVLQTKTGAQWKSIGEAKIDPLSRTATFRIAKWDATKDTPYRLVHGKSDYVGTVRAEPKGRPLVAAGYTGNTDPGFPNVEVVENTAAMKPDVLFFSGDQLYESVGGYGIVRAPTDSADDATIERASLNYLRKWYLFGWAFGDLMRDRPTVCVPDDHDVYQGNIWGEGGINSHGIRDHNKGGFAEHPTFVNAILRMQCSHMPDPYDPTPMKQGISVFYGPMNYGRVSFAIITDRYFKSGPSEKVNTWKGRPDHLRDPKYDMKKLDKPGLELLGKRQEKFLEEWSADWRGADLKCVLSATIFCNLANYHGGNQQFIFADLDSNGWPQSGRRRALEAMRRGFAFHYAGDQHLPSISRNGIDTWNDAGFAFCVPSIAAGYPRSWRPDKEGRPKQNRPKPGLANTGEYKDGFGNFVTVYGVGNPATKNRKGRINTLHDKSSGFGIVRFDPATQNITMECYRLQVDPKNLKPTDQFPGWPKTINVADNYGRKAAGHLPTLKIEGRTDPIVQVINEKTKQIEYTRRIKGKQYRPPIFDAEASYTVKVDGKAHTGVKPGSGTLEVSPSKD